MKNTLKFFGIIAVVAVIGFTTLGCVSTTPTNVNTSLDGVWNRGDIVITISGNNGIFTQINSGNWLASKNNGTINIGDQKLKNIAQVGNLRWTAQNLSSDANDHSIRDWKNCTITMSSNGRTIRLETQDFSPTTYTRM